MNANPFLTGLLDATPAEAPLFARKSALRNPLTARGATAKATAAKAVPVEPPTKKFKGAERDLPEELVAVQKDRGATLDAALELVSAFHINDIGLHEQWLGWSNVPAFQKSGAVNAGFEKEMKTLRSNVLLTSV